MKRRRVSCRVASRRVDRRLVARRVRRGSARRFFWREASRDGADQDATRRSSTGRAQANQSGKNEKYQGALIRSRVILGEGGDTHRLEHAVDLPLDRVVQEERHARPDVLDDGPGLSRHAEQTVAHRVVQRGAAARFLRGGGGSAGGAASGKDRRSGDAGGRRRTRGRGRASHGSVGSPR